VPERLVDRRTAIGRLGLVIHQHRRQRHPPSSTPPIEVRGACHAKRSSVITVG
jgi:hypothetical protein